ncbi:MAG TPA: hypothetical protein VFR76_02855, partial [Verrucomicrobiae bacterium]|nr:hypothetical protein [Verrucomicrobiae bacterium]
RVQWNLETYDAGGNPRVSGCAASGCHFHYFGRCSLTPLERIQGLVTWVNVDEAAGILDNGNGSSLTAKLTSALTNAASGNVQAAVNNVKAFHKKVEALVKTGRLPKAAAQFLISEAEAVIRDFGG